MSRTVRDAADITSRPEFASSNAMAPGDGGIRALGHRLCAAELARGTDIDSQIASASRAELRVLLRNADNANVPEMADRVAEDNENML